jgi:hypothetical protein
MALIEMHPPFHQHNGRAIEASEDEFSGVAWY